MVVSQYKLWCATPLPQRSKCVFMNLRLMLKHQRMLPTPEFQKTIAYQLIRCFSSFYSDWWHICYSLRDWWRHKLQEVYVWQSLFLKRHFTGDTAWKPWPDASIEWRGEQRNRRALLPLTSEVAVAADNRFCSHRNRIRKIWEPNKLTQMHKQRVEFSAPQKSFRMHLSFYRIVGMVGGDRRDSRLWLKLYKNDQRAAEKKIDKIRVE